MARLLTPTWDEILFAPVDAVERTFVGLEKEDGRKGIKKGESKRH